MTALEIKTELLKYCQSQVDNRYTKIKLAITAIEESMLEESKSSSGDKHETGRAMLQIERENAGKQLQEIEKVVLLVKKIDIKATSDYARLGSLVFTDKFKYFISISAGNIFVGNKDYLCVALNSPVGLLISGKKKDDQFNLNGTIYKITNVK